MKTFLSILNVIGVVLSGIATVLAALGLTAWVITAIAGAFVAVPLWFLWGWLAPTYLPFVPALYLNIGFWDTVGMVILIGLLKSVFLPKFVGQATTNVKGRRE